MERVTKKRLALYSGRTHPALAQEIALRSIGDLRRMPIVLVLCAKD